MKGLIDTAAVAQRYGNRPGFWAKRRVYGGGPPFFKVGKRVLYDPADVEIWLASRRRVSTSESNTAADGVDHAHGTR